MNASPSDSTRKKQFGLRSLCWSTFVVAAFCGSCHYEPAVARWMGATKSAGRNALLSLGLTCLVIAVVRGVVMFGLWLASQKRS